jgi:hypothetical protein
MRASEGLGATVVRGVGLLLVAVWAVGACGRLERAVTDPPSGQNDAAGQSSKPAPGAAGSGEGGGPSLGAAGERPGDGGASGGGGVAGEPGDGGEAGEPFVAPPKAVFDVCGGRSVELDPELVRRAVVFSACRGGSVGDYLREGLDGFVYHYDGGNVQHPWQGHSLYLAECPQAVLDCDDVWACLGQRPAAAACADDAVTRCEGQRAINCGPSPSITDCSDTTSRQGSCRVLGEGSEARARCVLSDGCTDAPEKRCEGDWIVTCDASGAKYGSDCSRHGLTCLHGRCEPPAVACTDVGQASCEQDRIRVCTPEGQLYERDCSRLGAMTCLEDGGDRPEDVPWFDCVPAGCSAPFEYPDTCKDDHVMVALADGTRSALRCADYGFPTCSNGRCMP